MDAQCIIAFAGHMLDRADRATPRFPAYAEPAVQLALRQIVHEIAPVAVVCSAACGGDLMFAEEALAFGSQLYVILPFERQTEFLEHSVNYAGPNWVERYKRVVAHATPPPYWVKSGGYTSDRNFEDNQRALIFFGLGVAAAHGASLKSLILCDRDQLGDRIGGTRSFLDFCRDLGVPYELIDIAAFR